MFTVSINKNASCNSSRHEEFVMFSNTDIVCIQLDKITDLINFSQFFMPPLVFTFLWYLLLFIYKLDFTSTN